MYNMFTALALAWIAGCGGGDTPKDTGGVDCEQMAIRGSDGAADACDLAACEACADACPGTCLTLESYPPQYACDGESWTVYDACPDWQLPEYSACDDVLTEVAGADITALGFSADDVLATLDPGFTEEAEWVSEEGRPATTVTVSAAAAGAPVFHDRSPSGTTGPDMQCLDQLEIPVTLRFTTADGAFDEAIATTLWVSELASVSAGAALDWRALSGRFAFVTLDPGEWDSVTLDLSTLVTPSFAGQVQVSATRELGPNTGEGLVGPLLRWPPQQ
ncbi:MAG: hypothetical protein ACI8PZ_004361 [Myxococcota bacterium]|jgi:hypothetical protein